MTRKTRIVAVDAGEHDSSATPGGEVETQATHVDEIVEDDPEESPATSQSSWSFFLALGVTGLALAAWTGIFIVSNLAQMQAGGTLTQWTGWVRDWAVPVLLLAVVWLLVMRNSRREAIRFGNTARLLNEESSRLEARLSVVNRELSLAREFIASQARDIETLGRVATERLSEHAENLASLIADNSNRLESIQTVSAAALENMESLRGHLPVIASSAKDVTNNIGTAGRAASEQIEELVAGFNRLHELGEASERQVTYVRHAVDSALDEFNRQADKMGEIAEQRFAALEQQGTEFRAQLDTHEVNALAAIRNRATALSEELEETRRVLDEHESESLTSLRARLTAIRDESSALVRSLREGENTSLQNWQAAIAQLESDLSDAILRIAEIDEKAIFSARSRVAALAQEAEELDNRLADRDRQFAAEIERRQDAFHERHARFIASLAAQIEGLDHQIDQRQTAQEQHGRQLIAQSETVVEQFDALARRLDEATVLGSEAEHRVAQSLGLLAENLAASREALNGTDAVIAELTEGGVRLLELIQASVQHSTTDLPKAMDITETKLTTVESRAATLKETLSATEASGERVANHIAQGSGELRNAIGQIATLSLELEAGGTRQAETIAAMSHSLERVRQDSLTLAEQAQTQLKQAIEELDRSARDATTNIATLSAAAIQRVAASLGEESAAAIDKAMRERAQEVAGQLELAVASAAGVSRDAAIQLRDQLAKVSELTTHLEQRIADARIRAEEQVDNDFARRVALITESLNSNAIDIARVMDSEVTDKAWSAYLRGDRGIFTRRAVRLLDSGEVKTIASLYEDDRTFREHVSRYIHDFEGMLRQLLSTRDGHALGVTLLSSDMGKLYVALAQAIERLRN